MTELQFDPIKHLYSLDGRALPGVTTILKGAGLIDTTWYTEESRQLGTFTHEAVKMQIDGDLDEESLSPLIQPYMAAFLSWRSQAAIEITASEQPVHYAGLYAGMLDLAGVTRKRSTLVDIKTGGPAPWHPLQTAAYAKAAKIPFRGCLYLRDDGTFRWVEHSDANDWSVFMSALALFNWKRNNGLIEWPERTAA